MHVESAAAIADLPGILAVADVDVAFLGLTNLSQSLGLPGQPDHPEVQALARQAAEQIVRSPVALGVIVCSAAAARQWQGRASLTSSTRKSGRASPEPAWS